MTSPEQLPSSREHTEQLSEAAAEQAEKLRAKYEKAGENLENSEKRTSVERANVEALFSKEQSAGERKSSGESSGGIKVKAKTVSKGSKKAAYNKTMGHVQSEMTPISRSFSKIIHAPAVEKVSEVIGSTAARPNAILAGSFTAFLFTLGIYALARTMGFTLSGFEMIGSFIFGWVIGILFDFLRIMITGKAR